MSLLTMLLIILGIFLFLIIAGVLFIWKGLPAIRKWLKEKYTPTINKGVARVIEGGIEKEYNSTLIAQTPLELTYQRDTKVPSIDGKSMVYIEDHFPLKVYKDGKAVGDAQIVLNPDLGAHVYRVDLGNCIAYPLTQAGAQYPEGLFNINRQALIQDKINQSVTEERGIDTKLVIIIIVAIVAIVGAVLISGVFKKPATIQVINTVNQTASQNYTPTAPIITGQVVP